MVVFEQLVIVWGQKNVLYSMNRQIAVCNRICFYHQIKRAWDIHESKVSRQGAVIDCQQPSTITKRANQTFRALSSNRRDEIQRDNNLLLKKLLDINETERTKKKAPKMKRCLPNLSIINKNQRETKQKRIEKQNEIMNNRLSSNTKASQYSLKLLNSEREKNQNYLSLRSKFGNKNGSQNKSLVRFEMKNSPQKYNKKFLTYHNSEVKVAEVVSVLNGIRYRITGEHRSQDGLEITIRNPVAATDKHTLKTDPKQTAELLKVFCESLKTLLQSVSYDSKNQHFFLRMPNSIEF